MSGSTSAPSLKEFQKHEQSTPGKGPHLPAPTGLFDDDDNDSDEDDNFFMPSSSKPSKTDKVKPTTIIFDDDEGDLFKEKTTALPAASVSQTDENKARTDKTITLPSSKNPKLVSETKTQKGLFSDEEDSEDLFSSQSSSKTKSASVLSSQPPASVSLFGDEDEEDNLFGSAAAKKQTSSLPPQSQEKAKPSEQPPKKASALFSSDEEDQWSVADSQTKLASERKSKGERWDAGTNQGQEAKAVKRPISLRRRMMMESISLLLRRTAKRRLREPHFCLKMTLIAEALCSAFLLHLFLLQQRKESIPKVPLLFSDEEDSEVPSGVKPVDLKAENAAASPEVGSADVANVAQKEGLYPHLIRKQAGLLIYFLLHLHWTKEPRVGPKLSLVCLMRTRTK